MDIFSENEIHSLPEIAAQYSLSENDPMLWGLYLVLNKDILDESEKEQIINIMRRLRSKNNNIARRNLEYMDRHKTNISP